MYVADCLKVHLVFVLYDLFFPFEFVAFFFSSCFIPLFAKLFFFFAPFLLFPAFLFPAVFLSLLTLSRCFTVSEASTDQDGNVCLRFFFSFSDMMCRATLLGRSTLKKKRKEKRYLRTSRQRGERNRVSFALYAGKQRESSAGIEKILKKKE